MAKPTSIGITAQSPRLLQALVEPPPQLPQLLHSAVLHRPDDSTFEDLINVQFSMLNCHPSGRDKCLFSFG